MQYGRKGGIRTPNVTTKGTDLQSVAEPPSLQPSYNLLVLSSGLEPELRDPQTRVLTNYTKTAFCFYTRLMY
jgi:hypothetical protein